MDTAEEPQKKIFKARKTMKTSDRQQLDAVHKAKEDLLNSTALRLVNGNHENGDSIMDFIHADKLSTENKKENVIPNVNHDSDVPIVTLSDHKESLHYADCTSDLKIPIEFTLPVTTEDVESRLVTSEDVHDCPANNDCFIPENVTILESTNQSKPEGLPLVENIYCDSEILVQHSQSDIPEVVKIPSIPKERPELNVGILVEDAIERESECEDILELSESNNEKTNLAIDSSNPNPQMVDSGAISKDEISNEHQSKISCRELNDNAMNPVENAEENFVTQDSQEFVNGPQELIEISDMIVPQSVNILEERRETFETLSMQQTVGEEAISSSMEVEQNVKADEQKTGLVAEIPFVTAVLERHTDSGFHRVNTMETDEIIPILEKLAPVEDELQCFSKSDVQSDNAGTLEDKTENWGTSPSKNDVSETLPSMAFLVLSDEEEAVEHTQSKENTFAEEATKIFTEEITKTSGVEQKEHDHQDVLQTEKIEHTRRKRAKSEDLDSRRCKRRRFESDEYEAELQVQITAGKDLNQKLQKVIQTMFEEKLSALQCINFDKAIADLKTRVEKIECKKHENMLHSMQAKIIRLTKRFGAAKDLKKKPETTVPTPVSPEKPAANDPNPSTNPVTYRNAGTVRQMLESKRNVGDSTTNNVHASASVAASPSQQNSSNLTLRTSNTTQMPINQPPVNTTLQSRAPPDWKLIQQKINASSVSASQNTLSSQSKPATPVTSAPVMTSVFPAPSTTTVVGNGQGSTNNTQPMSVSLQSLPVILHVPVAMPSQSQILQGTAGTLVTNQQSGNVEFYPVQNQSTVGSLAKTTPVSLPVTKAINSTSMPSPVIQRNSQTSSVASTIAVQAISTTHSIALSSRPSLTTAGIYTQATNRNITQLKSTVPGFNSSSATETPSGIKSDLVISRTPAIETPGNKHISESTALGGKPAPGVIDLTLDDEDAELSSQDLRRTSSASVTGSVQPSLSIGRHVQPPPPNTLQMSSAPAGLPSQATIHVLPTAQTTVTVTQRPVTQTATRASAPRAPNNPHMVYTTTTLATIPAQTPIRSTVMQNQNLRQITPQTGGGVSVRMPQTTAYVVNNGMSIGAPGPQLTVHHRPSQEPPRPIHPAPLPEAPQPQRLPPEAASTSPPQKPHLKLARVQSQNGIVLSWSVLEVDRSCAVVDSYHLYAYHEDPAATSSSQWKKIGEVKALPLPMACTLTQFVSGSKYYFAVRAKDIFGRFGPFCDPQSTDVISTQSS